MDFVDLINKYGFPIVAAGGTGYMIYYVWEWATKDIKPVLGEANTTLIALIDRIRMLDNDLIRMQQKVNTVLHLRGKIIESDRVMESQKVDAEADKKFKKALLEEGAGAEKKQPEEDSKKEKGFLAKDND